MTGAARRGPHLSEDEDDMTGLFNISVTRVGGLMWVKVGRFTMAFAISREFRPVGAKREDEARKPKARRYTARQVEAIARRERNAGRTRGRLEGHALAMQRKWRG